MQAMETCYSNREKHEETDAIFWLYIYITIYTYLFLYPAAGPAIENPHFTR
jgi:hypothetical protein